MMYIWENTAPTKPFGIHLEDRRHGISYLLEHDYADVYLKAIDQMLRVPKDAAFRSKLRDQVDPPAILTYLPTLDVTGSN